MRLCNEHVEEENSKELASLLASGLKHQREGGGIIISGGLHFFSYTVVRVRKGKLQNGLQNERRHQLVKKLSGVIHLITFPHYS